MTEEHDALVVEYNKLLIANKQTYEHALGLQRKVLDLECIIDSWKGKYDSMVKERDQALHTAATFAAGIPTEVASKVPTVRTEARVHKYPVQLTDRPVVDVRGLLRILYLGQQYSNLCMWVLVDPDECAPTTKVRLRIAGTGNPIADYEGLQYLQTVQMKSLNGELVWHIFREL